MATEITEFTHPQQRYGQALPLYPLPPVAHSALADGGVLTVDAATRMLLVQPGEDVRYTVTNDGSDPGAPAAGDPILKAGQRYEFSVEANCKIKVALA